MFAEFAPNVYIKEAWLRFYGVRLQTRMTVIRLAGGRLFVHSPTTLDGPTRAALDELGPVAFVVSPNKLHHQAIGMYRAAYPAARIYASPGLVERRPDVTFDAVLGDAPEPAWAADLDQAATQGNVFFSEILFFHRASRTLLTADLVENIHTETTAVGRWFLRCIGGYGRPVASPEFRMYTVDAAAARRGFERVQQWDYDRLIIAHGRLIERDAKAVVQSIYTDLLARVERRAALTRRLWTLVAKYQ